MNPVAIDPHRIRDLAYTRWQERGCPQGSAEQDWLEAEQVILREQGSRERAAVVSSPSVTVAAQTLTAQTAAAQTAAAPKLSAQKEAPSREASKRAKPPRPTLKRSPNARAAKLLNEVTPKPPTETRAQKAVAAAAAATAAPVKRTAVGSG